MRHASKAVLLLLGLVGGHAAAKNATPPVAEAVDKILFERLGTPHKLNLSSMSHELELLAPDQAAEQLRDWALLATVAQLDWNGASPDRSRLTCSLPPALRRTYLDALRPLPHGPGRLAVLSPEECLVLAPAVRGSDPTTLLYRFSVVCRLLDERRMVDRPTPKRIRLVVYEANAKERPPQITITYLGTIDGATFERPKYGLVTARVRTLAELEHALGTFDDLLEVRYPDDGACEVVGRRYPAAQYAKSYRRIDVTDLATIRQARGEVPGRAARTPSNLGFSLDPWINPQPLAAALRVFAAGSDPLVRANRTVIEQTADRLARSQPFPKPDSSNADETRLFALVDAFRETPKRDADHPGRALERLISQHSFQAPLYMGGIKGTEVGMTLYYTDLMAKLYALGSIAENDGPRQALEVPGQAEGQLHSVPTIKLAAFHRAKANQLNHARLWWAPRTAGFLQLANGTLRFAPVTATLFMKSRASQTAQEVDASLQYATFCREWNDSYLAIADTNPEFHRLNQIMKWSVVLKAVNDQHDAAWAVLDSVDPKHSTRFAAWYKQGLGSGRLAGPQSLPFRESSQDQTADALALIQSQPYQEYRFGATTMIAQLEGGVDTATDEQIAERTLPPGSGPPSGMPADMSTAADPAGAYDPSHGLVLAGGRRVQTFDEGRKIADTGQPSTLIRDVSIELDKPVENPLAPVVMTTSIDQEAASNQLVLTGLLQRGKTSLSLGRLAIEVATLDTITFNWRASGLDGTATLSERVARGFELEPNRAWYSSNGRRLFVRTDDPDNPWHEMKPGAELAAAGLKVGQPGDNLWYLVEPVDTASLPSESARVAATTPRYTIIEPGLKSGAPAVCRRSWLDPHSVDAARSEMTIHGQSGTISMAEDGTLVATGEKLGEFLRWLKPPDLDQLVTGLRTDHSRSSLPIEVGLNDSGYVVRKTAKGWSVQLGSPAEQPLEIRKTARGLQFAGSPADVKIAGRLFDQDAELRDLAVQLERPTVPKLINLARLLHGTRQEPLKPEHSQEGWSLHDPGTGAKIDLGAVLAAAHQNQPRPPQIENLLQKGVLVIETVALSAEQFHDLNATVVEAGIPVVYRTNNPGAVNRLKGLANLRRSIKVTCDATVLNLKKFGRQAMEIIGSGFQVGDPDQINIHLIVLHPEDGRDFDEKIAQQAKNGEFQGDDVVLGICNLDEPRMLALRDVILQNNPASVTMASGALDVGAITLVMSWLARHPGELDGRTIDILPQSVYDRTYETIERCRKSFDPKAEILEQFGPRASELLLRDGRLIDDEAIQKLLDAIRLNGRSFRIHTDRMEPPRLRLVA